MSTAPQTWMQRLVYRLKRFQTLMAIGKVLNPARRVELRWVLHGLQATHTGKILDVGCGDGFWTQMVARRTGRRITGLDPFSVDIEVAKRRNAADADFVIGHAESLPFPDESFDAVMSVCVFEHLSDDERAFREIHRVLRTGGLLVATVDSMDSPFITDDHRTWHMTAFQCAHLYPGRSLDQKLESLGFGVKTGSSLMGSNIGVWWEMFSERNRILKHIVMPFVLLPVWIAERRSYVTGYKYGIVAQKV